MCLLTGCLLGVTFASLSSTEQFRVPSLLGIPLEKPGAYSSPPGGVFIATQKCQNSGLRGGCQMSYLWGQEVKGQKVLIIIRNRQALYVPNMGNLRSLYTGCVVFCALKIFFGLTYS